MRKVKRVRERLSYSPVASLSAFLAPPAAAAGPCLPLLVLLRRCAGRRLDAGRQRKCSACEHIKASKKGAEGASGVPAGQAGRAAPPLLAEPRLVSPPPHPRCWPCSAPSQHCPSPIEPRLEEEPGTGPGNPKAQEEVSLSCLLAKSAGPGSCDRESRKKGR